MNYVFGMRRCKSACNLLGAINRFARRDRSLIQVGPQVLAFKQLGDDVWRTVLRSNVVNR